MAEIIKNIPRPGIRYYILLAASGRAGILFDVDEYIFSCGLDYYGELSYVEIRTEGQGRKNSRFEVSEKYLNFKHAKDNTKKEFFSYNYLL